MTYSIMIALKEHLKDRVLFSYGHRAGFIPFSGVDDTITACVGEFLPFSPTGSILRGRYPRAPRWERRMQSKVIMRGFFVPFMPRAVG